MTRYDQMHTWTFWIKSSIDIYISKFAEGKDKINRSLFLLNLNIKKDRSIFSYRPDQKVRFFDADKTYKKIF